MLKVKRILYPTDFWNCSEQALDLALFFVKKFDAELFMLHVVVLHQDELCGPDQKFPAADEIAEHLSDLAHSKLGQLAEPRSEQGMVIHQVKERGLSAAETILEYAGNIQADVIVMGTHGRRGAGRLFLGSVAEEVVRGSECPVLTRRETTDAPSLDPIGRILVPVDFSEQSMAGVQFAKEVASISGARLQMLHVIELKTLPSFYGETTVTEIAERMEERSISELSRLVGAAPGPSVPYECHVERGNTPNVIAQFADEKNSDLIVMPTHGLTGIKRMILGSTAERVVRLASCPVFTLKSFGKSLVALDS
jgi:nucleotide-binding universal stress UspA family protein